MSNSLRPHGLQHTRLPCPLLSHGVCLNSCPLSQRSHPTASSSAVPFSMCRQSFPASGSLPMKDFSSEPAVHIRWPKYWSFSFSISPSNEESGLISFRVGWFDEDISEQILKTELDQGWCSCQICFSPQGCVSQHTGPSQLFLPQYFT